MYCIRKLKDDLIWVGGNDRRLALFENVLPLQTGASYNSWLLLDDKTLLVDTADACVSERFFENLAFALAGRDLDYLLIEHMEPDHGALIAELCRRHPETRLLASAMALNMLAQFFPEDLRGRAQAIKEGESLSLGRRQLHFVAAPMVHWPEVMLAYESTDKILFSADAFGTFGAMPGLVYNDEVNFDRDWLPEARRYYTNIVGKYGPQVQAVLAKAAKLDIDLICPLHGPAWRSDFAYLLDKYDKWSRYQPEDQEAVIFATGVFGHTVGAAEVLGQLLVEAGVPTRLYEVSGQDRSFLVAEAFRCSHLVFAATTYNMRLFPPMEELLTDLAALNLQQRRVAVLENGTWAPKAGSLMLEHLNAMGMEQVAPPLTLRSAMKAEQLPAMEALAAAIAADFR